MKGSTEEARKIILRQGRVRFGPPDEAVQTRLNAIVELEELERLSERLLNVPSWDELMTEG